MSSPIIQPQDRLEALTDNIFFDDGVARLGFSESLALLAIKENAPLEIAGSQPWEVVASFMVGAATFFSNDPSFLATYNTVLFNSLSPGEKVQYILEDLSEALSFMNGSTFRIAQSIEDFAGGIILHLRTPGTITQSYITNFLLQLYEVSIGARAFNGSYPPGPLLPSNGDLSILSNISPPIDTEKLFEGDIPTNTTGFFQEFAREYKYGAQGVSDSGPAEAFLNAGLTVTAPALINFMLNFFNASTAVVSLQENTPANSIFDLMDFEATAFGVQKFNSYEAVYRAFNPTATTAEFQAALEEFYEEVRQHNIAFVPSRVFDAWVEKTQREFVSGAGGALSLPFVTSLQSNQSERVRIIDRLIALIASLIDTMQRITATQARQLDFLTSLQREYTDLQNNIPIFTVSQAGLGASIGQNADDDEDDANRRNDVNTFNQQIIETIKGRKQIEENKAKQVQTLVNQSNDAVNQQAEIATTLLQQLSSLLQAIYR